MPPIRLGKALRGLKTDRERFLRRRRDVSGAVEKKNEKTSIEKYEEKHVDRFHGNLRRKKKFEDDEETKVSRG